MSVVIRGNFRAAYVTAVPVVKKFSIGKESTEHTVKNEPIYHGCGTLIKESYVRLYGIKKHSRKHADANDSEMKRDSCYEKTTPQNRTAPVDALFHRLRSSLRPHVT